VLWVKNADTASATCFGFFSGPRWSSAGKCARVAFGRTGQQALACSAGAGRGGVFACHQQNFGGHLAIVGVGVVETRGLGVLPDRRGQEPVALLAFAFPDGYRQDEPK
jgi:hypothetical protein